MLTLHTSDLKPAIHIIGAEKVERIRVGTVQIIPNCQRYLPVIFLEPCGSLQDIFFKLCYNKYKCQVPFLTTPSFTKNADAWLETERRDNRLVFTSSFYRTHVNIYHAFLLIFSTFIALRNTALPFYVAHLY